MLITKLGLIVKAIGVLISAIELIRKIYISHKTPRFIRV